MYSFSFEALQKAVLTQNFSGLCLVPVIQIPKCHKGFILVFGWFVCVCVVLRKK